MNTITNTVDLRTLAGKKDIKASVIIIGSAVLPALHRCYGSMEFWGKSTGDGSSMAAALFMFATAFILLGALPVVLIRRVFHEPLSAYGISWGDWKAGLAGVAIFVPLIGVLLLYPASQTSEIRAFYPFAREAGTSWESFALLEFSRVALFYTAWEFFFRGFMLYGLREQFGAWQALCIQVVPQCLWHVGMPTGELLSSIAGGVLFALMTLRTGSIVWALILHCFIGICTDALVVVTR
jgi:membrane protease YdiL (CAAX protease family)